MAKLLLVKDISANYFKPNGIVYKCVFNNCKRFLSNLLKYLAAKRSGIIFAVL